MKSEDPDVKAVHDVVMGAAPTAEHKWLQKLVGEWTYHVDAPMKAGEAPTRITGTETVRSLGALWIVAEGRSQMPDGPAVTMMTLGYDPGTRRFVGTWIGSMMTHLWVYDGGLEPGAERLALDSEGPSMADDGTMSQYRDVIEFKSDDHRLLIAQVKAPDGQWQPFMTTEYRRRRA